jgi:alpha-L-fucosidase
MGNSFYLHIFDWPADGKILVPLPGSKERLYSATVLATGEKLKTATDAEGVTVSVPSAAPDKISSTIVLELKGSLHI